MGLLRRDRREVSEERSTFTFQQLGAMVASSSAGAVVTDVDRALFDAATWACIDVLASSVSSLPLDAVRQQGAVRVPVTPEPSLLSAPSGIVTLDVWLYQLMWSLLADGNAFGVVTGVDGMGRPTSIELVDPSVVTNRTVTDGRPSVSVDGGGPEPLYPFGRIWHVPGKMTRPGSPFGLSPVVHAGRSTGTSLAVQRFAGDFFTDNAHPIWKISSDRELTAEQAADVKAMVGRSRQSREPMVFGAGLSMDPTSADLETTQYLDLLRFEVEQTCRFFRVPPSMIYGAVSGQSVTYANVSQADLAYLKHSLDGYLVRIERALTECLPRPQVVKFNRDALLRSDTLTRYQAHEVAISSGFLTIDEVRELEDRPPLPDDEGGPSGPSD